jgi:hypothetical protein
MLMLIAVIILNDKCSDYYDKYTLHHFVFSVSQYDQMLGYMGEDWWHHLALVIASSCSFQQMV